LTFKVRRAGLNGHDMQFTRSLCASLLLSAALTSQASSQAYPGQEDVTVNSGAIGRGYLLYPGGKYGRTVRPLLQPGEKPDAVIHLHMPTHRHHSVAAATPDAEPVAPHVARTRAKPATPAVSTNTADLPEDSASRLVGAGAAPPPAKPMRAARIPQPPAANTGATTVPFSFSGAPVAPSPPPARTASATPPARTTPSGATAAGLRRETIIPFAAGATSLAPSNVNSIHALATTLNTALASGNARIHLDAFGGPRGDKSSDSRRLSLKRALVVRELLIEDGVPSEKIDVRALGGADDGGAPDRVDVFVGG
jgi:outer membrane protein OmpA-like peptidoglycan-associated protein